MSNAVPQDDPDRDWFRGEAAATGCQVHQGSDASRRLNAMGLRAEFFERALVDGHDKASRVSKVHPRTFPGQVMWAETVASLRTQLLDLGTGWSVGYTGNCETCYNLSYRVAIAVVGGDSSTGEQAFRPPKAARKRGPAIGERVKRNPYVQDMLDLPEFREMNDDEQCTMWFLMANARDGRMYHELALPTSLGGDNRVGVYGERIIMPPIPLKGASITPDDGGDREPPQVDVGRK